MSLLLQHDGRTDDARDRCQPVAQGPAKVIAQLLGRFRVTLDDVEVDTRSSRRTRNMLAYLLTHRRQPVPRDVLMEVFWPTADEPAARNCLHVAICGARQALRAASEASVIERWFDCYQLADTVAVWTDVDAFERQCRDGAAADRAGDRAGAIAGYEAAAQLYEGDFLADDPYLDWAMARREDLRLQAVESQRRLVDLYGERGDHGPAIELARRTLAMDPCNEAVHRALISSYAAVGQVHLALGQYRIAAETLWDTFGTRPSNDTIALVEQVRSGH